MVEPGAELGAPLALARALITRNQMSSQSSSARRRVTTPAGEVAAEARGGGRRALEGGGVTRAACEHQASTVRGSYPCAITETACRTKFRTYAGAAAVEGCSLGAEVRPRATKARLAQPVTITTAASGTSGARFECFEAGGDRYC